ncbi:MAG: hypothetical protein K2H09_09830 [Treponemataceae bacterium]|nr:hypothetical protein [Treponemataceae bacterium]
MKRIALIAGLCAALVLGGCRAKPDANGWYEDFDAAKKVAAAQDKNILLFVNSDVDFDGSADGVALLLSSPEFTEALSERYVCVHFDFTEEARMMGFDLESATSEEQKAAEKNQALKERQYEVADLLFIRETPSVIITTKEGYYVATVVFDYLSPSVDGYVQLVEQEDEAVQEISALAAAARKGSALERVRAIDALYNATPQTQTMLLAELYRKVPDLDKKNETGLVSKYLVATAHSDAYARLVKMEVAEAVDVYEKFAEDSRLDPVDRQTLYYAAANLLISSGAPDIDGVVSLLDKAVEAAPESSYAENIAELIARIISFSEQDRADAEAQSADAK